MNLALNSLEKDKLLIPKKIIQSFFTRRYPSDKLFLHLIDTLHYY